MVKPEFTSMLDRHRFEKIQ